MANLYKVCLVGLLVAVSASAEDRSARTAHPTPSIHYYFIDKVVQSGPIPGQDAFEEDIGGRGPFNQAILDDGEANPVSTRQLSLLGAIFNNRFSNGNSNLNNFRPLSGGVWPVIRNPSYGGVLSSYESCTASSGQSGVCVNGGACALIGGQSSGGSTCGFGVVCCVNTVAKCAGTVTVNNTYFQSPAPAIVTPTSCTVTVKLDKRLPEQKQAICQLRLDFVSFTIAQPAGVDPVTTSTQCLTDNFQVGGALNTVPPICGDNDGQHMYIHVPRSDITPSDVRLTFNIGPATVSRSWNIKIAMLPCAATYLAPTDCLQYFTGSSGTVSSFNWKDVADTAIRQLASQDYKICFRNEILNTNQKANSICITPCTTTATDANAFSISNTDDTANAPTCLDTTSDFLAFVNGVDATAAAADRFCGGQLNPTDAEDASVTVCSTSKPFEIYYKTDAEETEDEVGDGFLNQGFCLTYQQRAV